MMGDRHSRWKFTMIRVLLAVQAAMMMADPVLGQGTGGGGGGGGGGGSSGSYHSGGSGSGCFSPKTCPGAFWTVISLLIFFATCGCLRSPVIRYKFCAWRPMEKCLGSGVVSQEEYLVQQDGLGAQPSSGTFCGKYSQYGRWHAVPNFEFSVNPSRGTANGMGQDEVGRYTLSGASRGSRVALKKTYIPGTGDANENSGHSVEMRLQFQKTGDITDAKVRNAIPVPYAWVGKWYIRQPRMLRHGMSVIWQVQPTEGEEAFITEAVPISTEVPDYVPFSISIDTETSPELTTRKLDADVKLQVT